MAVSSSWRWFSIRVNRQIIQPVFIHHLTGLLKNVSRRSVGVLFNELIPPLIPTSRHLSQPFPMHAFLVCGLSQCDRVIIDAYPPRCEEGRELPREKVVIRKIWWRECPKLRNWQRQRRLKGRRAAPVLKILVW